ncbi:MAG TPA: pitrilysin family protein [Thermodesulfobacteriota bacterium]|nr:pitrilysin family protein [Thermodesulfobacteriota bacterium]
MTRVRKDYLRHGIKLITEEMPDAESASIGVWVKKGSRDETLLLGGVSHFIEHLLFKGTAKRTALDIAREIEGVGGVLNAFTGREYTCFYAKVLNKDISVAVELLSDILMNSLFDRNELEKERLVVLQEIKMVEDTPDDLIHDLFADAMWAGQAAGRPVLGSKKTVESFSRQTVVDYFKKNYRVDSIFITVAGGIKHKNVVKLLDKAFGGLKNRERGLGKGANSGKTSERAPVACPGGKVVRRKLEQVHFCIGAPTVPQPHPDRHKLYLLNTILGGGMSSRLFQEVREKRGLAYSVYSYLNLMMDAGALVIYAGTSKEDFKKAVRLIMGECRKITSSVSSKELKNAKEQLKGGMLLALDTSDSRMMKAARDEIYFGRVQSVREIVAAIDRVKARDVTDAAGNIFSPRNMTMVAVGKVAEEDMPALRA